MTLTIVPYLNPLPGLPQRGRSILAQYDEESVVVYQAYRPAIANFAVERGYFGGEFRFNRMSWIKPSFLWMMYRSGWATKEGQEVILAVRIQRAAFDTILAAAVLSKYDRAFYPTPDEWQQALKASRVRLQWDPDRHPTGAKLDRRAIQLGLRGEYLRNYAADWLLGIEDITNFVRQQVKKVGPQDWENLWVPQESLYPVRDPRVAARLGLGERDVSGEQRLEG